MSKDVAEVALPVNVDQIFDYLVLPLQQAAVGLGKRIRVRFAGRLAVGFIVGLKGRSSYRGKLNQIIEILDQEPVLDAQRLELARWLSEYYLTPLGPVLQGLAPARSLRTGSPTRASYVQLQAGLPGLLLEIERLARRAPQQAALLKALLVQSGPPTAAELLRTVGTTSASLRALEKKGLIKLERKRAAGPPAANFHEPASQVELTGEQRAALSRVCDALGTRGGKPLLLHGVNGSGKTEVYIRAVARALELGREAIVVVPEISLTPQLVARFHHRFGEQIALYHSGLTGSELACQWARMAEGEARLVIGVRAAIFAPFKNLGLIVVDEEHEPTYKQEEPAPRYHLREVALRRAEICGATVLLGSATPTLESYYRAEQGELELLELRERVVGPARPKVEIIDMQGERPATVFSKRLREALEGRLERGEQAILLLNRRGLASALCRHCGSIFRCPHCHIPLVYHLHGQELLCHYCGRALKHPRCSSCGSTDLTFFGLGTEQIELELGKLFPNARVRRMDSDAVRRGEHGLILEEFRRGEIDILFGTQMIGVGLDFPSVTLVGIVSADTTLALPDYRAGERAFQLISQAAGRAGRGPQGGEVLIQTYYPEHYAVQAAAEQDYLRFYHQEIRLREDLGYPPFTHLIQLTVEDYAAARAEERALHIKESLTDGFEILGPVRGPRARVRGRYQRQLLLKGEDGEVLRGAVKGVLKSSGREGLKIDVDPSF
jgi:primosomal protein N' (replication factor Y)